MSGIFRSTLAVRAKLLAFLFEKPEKLIPIGRPARGIADTVDLEHNSRTVKRPKERRAQDHDLGVHIGRGTPDRFHADLMKLMFDIWAESLRAGTQFDIKGMYERYRAVIASILQEGIDQDAFRSVDPQLTAATLIAAMDGLMLQWVMDASLFNLKEMGHTLTDTFLQGIRAI